jgi:hypothetical protein
VFALVFIILLVVSVFAADIGRRWWRENEWRRRWRRRDAIDEDD